MSTRQTINLGLSAEATAELVKDQRAVRMEFTVEFDGKSISGKVDVNEGPEICTLPMMITGMLPRLADDCPEIHQAKEIRLVATMEHVG